MGNENRISAVNQKDCIAIWCRFLPSGHLDIEKMRKEFEQGLLDKQPVHHYAKVTLYYCVDGYMSHQEDDIKSIIDNDLRNKDVEFDYSDIIVTDTQEF